MGVAMQVDLDKKKCGVWTSSAVGAERGIGDTPLGYFLLRGRLGHRRRGKRKDLGVKMCQDRSGGRAELPENCVWF